MFYIAFSSQGYKSAEMKRNNKAVINNASPFSIDNNAATRTQDAMS